MGTSGWLQLAVLAGALSRATHEARRRYLLELRSQDLDIPTLTTRARSIRLPDARFLRTVYVPEDGACYLLLEAGSIEAARDGARMLGCPEAELSPVVELDTQVATGEDR